MVAQAALSVVPTLPPIPPTKNTPYQGEQATAAVRASLQKALDGYTPGNITLIVAAPAQADLKHTRSFGETHAQELSRIGNASTQEPSVAGNIPITPPPTTATAPPPQPSYPPQQPQISPTVSPTLPSATISPPASTIKAAPIAVPVTVQSPTVGGNPTQSPPLNPSNLNQAPAPIPLVSGASSVTSPVVAPDPADPSTKVPSVTPTVAETGVPKVAGPEGPGPANGSLLDKNAPESPKANPFSSPVSSQAPSATAAPTFESAEDEKKRLEREEREKLLHGEGTSTSTAPAAAPHYESAEEEKKRLEREEREKILQAGGSDANKPSKKDDSDDLPPYQEF